MSDGYGTVMVGRLKVPFDEAVEPAFTAHPAIDLTRVFDVVHVGGKLPASGEDALQGELVDFHLSDFAHAVTDSFQAQQAMFPRMVTPEVTTAIRQLSTNVLGYKLAGAGGGGYLVAIATSCPDGFEPLRVRYGDD